MREMCRWSCSVDIWDYFTGKSAIVAQRMAASLASTGTPAHFVHATEWAHGDLGMQQFSFAYRGGCFS